MPKEIKCSECGKKMRSKRYHSTVESNRHNIKRLSRGGRGYKYMCNNDECPNYRKEFDYWELED